MVVVVFCEVVVWFFELVVVVCRLEFYCYLWFGYCLFVYLIFYFI